MAKPPLDLEVMFRDPGGADGKTYTHYATNENNQATIGALTTKLQTGFESASVELNRDMRYTYGSPRIMQEMIVRGAGKSVWEGRVDRVPPSRADSVEASGWYQATKDTGGVAEIYIGADINDWGQTPTDELARILTASYSTQAYTWENTGGALVCLPPAQSTPANAAALWYTCPPGVTIGSISYNGSESNVSGGTWVGPRVVYTVDDVYAGGTDEIDSLTLDSTSRTAAPSNTGIYRFASIDLVNTGTLTPTAGAHRKFTALAIYGNHGLDNIYASEVIKHAIGKYCPLLTADSNTVADTTYSIGHLVFDGAKVEDVLLRCNAFHLFEIAVWENRELFFQPAASLDDYDYELSISDTATLEPAGPEVDDDEPANGVWVYYNDVSTGRRERVGPYGTSAPYDPDGDTSLLTSLDENPVNRGGQTRFPPLDLSNPCTRADAIVLGALWLAERQIPTTVGVGSVTGYVKNRAGQTVPAWMIRAGDRVKYTHETSVIRRVYSTRYDPQTHTNSLVYERPVSTIEGVTERQSVALLAKGIK